MDKTLQIFLIAIGLLVGAGYAWRRFVRICEASNGANWGGKWLNRLDGLNRLFCRKFHRLRHDPLPLPTSGPALVVANHVSGLDPLVLIAAADRPLRFMIAREQYDRWWLKWLFRSIGCIPIERTRNPRTALRFALNFLRQGEVVALFPYGRIHLDDDPSIRIKRGVLYLAQSTGAPIIPVRIDGIQGKGFTLPAVFIPSRARLRASTPIYYENRDPHNLLEELGRRLTRGFSGDSG